MIVWTGITQLLLLKYFNSMGEKKKHARKLCFIPISEPLRKLLTSASLGQEIPNTNIAFVGLHLGPQLKPKRLFGFA